MNKSMIGRHPRQIRGECPCLCGVGLIDGFAPPKGRIERIGPSWVVLLGSFAVRGV
jgi:hypothetical protein